MEKMYRVNVFISHSWAYSEHYDKLAEWIFKERWSLQGAPINFYDMSVPKENPIHFSSSEAELRTAIFGKISLSDVIVIPTGMYANHSKWIKKEIEGARKYAKPIIAIDPWGQERKSSVVRKYASETIGWNKKSVINSVFKYGKTYPAQISSWTN